MKEAVSHNAPKCHAPHPCSRVQRQIGQMSFKRPRTPSHSSSSSSSSSLGHTSKVFRTTPNPSSESATSTHRLLCTLPPTCNHHPTPIANIKDLEAHYATYHAHVCEEGGCGCVFPDARLLELVSDSRSFRRHRRTLIFFRFGFVL